MSVAALDSTSNSVIPAKAAIHVALELCDAGGMHTYRPKTPCVYLLCSQPDGILYAGVTSALSQRVSLHHQKLVDGFTKRYGVSRLVYYEMHDTMNAAILRETQIKKWKRAWKVRLILQNNPEWLDLFDEATGEIFPLPGDV